MIINSLYAFIATFGFCILFNIRGKNLFYTSLGGGVTWFFYLLADHFSSSNIFALFIASIVAGIYSEIMARVLKSPVTTFSICAIIPLVPGGGMYNTMLQLIQGNVNNSLTTGLATLSSAGAIAVGILLASSFTKLMLFFTKQKKVI
ncbi:threonine/serine exporter family protein [Clostridium omnivorum]|uniref:threonine/serine exporter family protein n=1 Tax=Clostridium omnivorum TaxID=1604902 RepID=UPI00222E7216|nr:threonine/serine exporter family protein [Clostridium sp. E14]